MTDRFTDMANRVRWDLMSRPPSDAVAIIEQALRQAHKRGVEEGIERESLRLARQEKLRALGFDELSDEQRAMNMAVFHLDKESTDVG